MKKLKICSNGHRYYKSSDCPTCPQCEKERVPVSEMLAMLKAPARRALESKGITDAYTLSQYRENEILDLHGMGPSSMPALRTALEKVGLTFRK